MPLSKPSVKSGGFLLTPEERQGGGGGGGGGKVSLILMTSFQVMFCFLNFNLVRKCSFFPFSRHGSYCHTEQDGIPSEDTNSSTNQEYFHYITKHSKPLYFDTNFHCQGNQNKT